MTPDQSCPCGSKKTYERCCLPFHTGTLSETAEQLMRSRYSAFALGVVDYLIASHHPDKRQPNDRAQLQDSINNTRWLSLEIVETNRGLARDKTGMVEFKAIYLENNQLGVLHERSEFLFEDRWYYHSGNIMPTRLDIGRNDLCPCGSGLKYKKCHG